MSPLSLRPALLVDVPQLVSLVNSAYRGDSSRKGWTTEAELLDGQRTDPESLAALIDPPDRVVLLAEAPLPAEPARLAAVGCVHLERATPGHGAYLGMLTIHPDGQARGLGSALLDAAESHARAAWNAVTMRMTVIAQRAELLAWYERRGYAQTGKTAPFPYADSRFGLPKREDLYFVILEKTLAAIQV